MIEQKSYRKVLFMTREDFIKLKEATPQIIKENLNKYWGTKLPIDAVALANRVGFKVYSMQMPKQYNGILLVDETKELSKNQPERRMAINSELSREQMRFVVMHELSHYFIHKFIYPDKLVQIALREEYRDKDGKHISGKRDDFENYVDYVAACFFMPKEEVEKDIKRFDVEKEKEDLVKFLVVKYDVSKEMASRRIVEVMSGR